MVNILLRNRGNVFDFDLHGNIVTISGDSGTGKSLFFKAVEENYHRGRDNKLIPISEVMVNDIEIFKQIVKNNSNKIIVIDNAEVILDDNLIDIINKDRYNNYIIIGRGKVLDNLRSSFLSKAEIFYEESTHKFKLKYMHTRSIHNGRGRDIKGF